MAWYVLSSSVMFSPNVLGSQGISWCALCFQTHRVFDTCFGCPKASSETLPVQEMAWQVVSTWLSGILHCTQFSPKWLIPSTDLGINLPLSSQCRPAHEPQCLLTPSWWSRVFSLQWVGTQFSSFLICSSYFLWTFFHLSPNKIKARPAMQCLDTSTKFLFVVRPVWQRKLFCVVSFSDNNM